MFELSEDQKKAFDLFCEWQKSSKKLLTLAGYAGTGKSFLISYIKEQFPQKRIAFCAFTGKAALVLKDKLKGFSTIDDYVGTIHGLIYVPIIDKKTKQIKGWRKQIDIDYDLIIIDEASMVDGKIFDDISSYGIPILAVGDHYQLSPVSGDFNLMEKPEIKLETLHRYAQNLPLIKVATMARETGNIPYGEYGEGIIKTGYRKFMNEKFDYYIRSQDFASGNSIIICAYNKTRIELNNRVRRVLGFRGDPKKGDRLICLKNNRDIYPPVFNGLIGTLDTINESPFNSNLFFAKINLDGNEIPFYGDISKECFNNQSPNLYSGKKKDKIGYFDYGFVITCHRCQGSGYQNVLVIEQECDLWEHKRWFYTAVSRSSKNLIILK